MQPDRGLRGIMPTPEPLPKANATASGTERRTKPEVDFNSEENTQEIFKVESEEEEPEAEDRGSLQSGDADEKEHDDHDAQDGEEDWDHESLDSEAVRQSASVKRKGGFIRAASRGSLESGNMTVVAKVRRFLDNQYTQIVSSLLIVFTIMLICMDTDLHAKKSDVPLWQRVTMGICFIAYVLEFAASVYVQGIALAAHDKWTFIDIGVIFASCLDYVLAWTNTKIPYMRMLKTLRLLRLGKLLRSIRTLQHIPIVRENYTLCVMLVSCVRTVTYAFVLCFFVMTMWSILAVEVLNDTYSQFDFDANCPRCHRAFSDIWSSNWTWMATMVVRDSCWGGYFVPILEEHFWVASIVIGLMATVSFGVLTIIPAVVVDTFRGMRENDIASMAMRMEFKETAEKKALKKIFDQIDEDQSGEINFDEVRQGAARVLEFRQYLRVLDIDEKDLEDLFEMIDQDGSGDVSPDEFIEALYRLKNSESKTATMMVKFMVAALKEKQDQIKTQLVGVQSQFMDRLAEVEVHLQEVAANSPRSPRLGKNIWDTVDVDGSKTASRRGSRGSGGSGGSGGGTKSQRLDANARRVARNEMLCEDDEAIIAAAIRRNSMDGDKDQEKTAPDAPGKGGRRPSLLEGKTTMLEEALRHDILGVKEKNPDGTPGTGRRRSLLREALNLDPRVQGRRFSLTGETGRRTSWEGITGGRRTSQRSAGTAGSKHS